MLASLWHWYTTAAPSSCSICGHQDNALIAIASVAAVAWTGGLVAYQLKQYTVARAFALEILQASFMGAIFALFMTPLILRYVATAFTLYYVAGALYGLLVQTRDNASVRKMLKGKAANLNETEMTQVRKVARQYVWLTLASMLAYVAVIIWPYPLTVAGITAALLFAGYQTVIWQLNVAPDRANIENVLSALMRPKPAPPLPSILRVPITPPPPPPQA